MSSQSQIKGVAQSSTPTAIPEGSIWYDTSNDILKASDGTTYNQIGRTSFSGAAVVSHSTTIGDYTTPTSVTSGDTAATFYDDFSTYADVTAGDAAWPTSDNTRLRVNPTTDVLDFTFGSNGLDLNCYYDIGTANISETTWNLRFKLTLSTYDTSGTAANACNIVIELSSAHALGNPSVEDALGIVVECRDDNNRFWGWINNGGTTASTDTGVTITAGTYYIELVRLDANNFRVRVFSDSDFTTQLSTNTITISNAYAGLRYLTAHILTQTVSACSIIGTIDNINFNNGSTSSGPVPTKDNIKDGNTATEWISTTMNNPYIYLDMGSALNLCAVAIYWDNTSTETEIKIQSSADAVTWTDRRKITTSNLTNGAYNYYRFNVAGGARYIRIYGTGTSKVLKIFEAKVMKKTDAEIFNDLGIVSISASDTALDSDGV